MLDELKIYIKMNGNEIGDGSYESLNDTADKIHFYFMQSAKYKAMWKLRDIEDEYKESGGHILLSMLTLNDEFKTQAIGFSDELSEKISWLLTK